MMKRQLLAIAIAATWFGTMCNARQTAATPEHAAEQGVSSGKAERSSQNTAATLTKPDGPHGGSLKNMGELQVETVVEPGGVRLFTYNSQGQPFDLRNVRGVATLQLKGAAKRYRYDLFPEIRQDQSADALSVRVDLRQIAGQEGVLSFQLYGLTGGGRPMTFNQALDAPLSEQQKVTAAIAKQKVCPVSGALLGSMGESISVTKDGETIFVCCAGCVENAKAHFAEYQQKLKPSGEFAVALATQADAEAIKLQSVCPVTSAPLGSMGTPLKVTGLERDVYLCCQGCVDRFKMNLKKYLAELPPLPHK